jgi:hypothetical protein
MARPAFEIIEAPSVLGLFPRRNYSQGMPLNQAETQPG